MSPAMSVFLVVVVVVAACFLFFFKVIYFASPAEVLFDDAGQLQASKDGLVSAAWLGASNGCGGWQGTSGHVPSPTKMVGGETGISLNFLFFKNAFIKLESCLISLAGIMLASSKC